MGVVIVWLSWLHYVRSQGIGHEGSFEKAYLMGLNEGSVWVQAEGCMPIETTGRMVTHFVKPESPVSEE
jgi:hypothetical protein